MSIYKQIIYLSLLLVVVMGFCTFTHINDFPELEDKKVEIIVETKDESVEKNNKITQISVPEENLEEKTLEKEELDIKELSTKESIKEEIVEESKVKEKEPVDDKKVEEVEEKEPVVESKDAQKELDLIVSKQKIYFKRLGTDVTEKSFVVIKEISEYLKQNENIKIEIGGHTDAKGKDDVNEWVSLQRALSVKKELINLGIDKKRIKAKGYGETKPLVPNDKNGYSSENRRVEFKIIEE